MPWRSALRAGGSLSEYHVRRPDRMTDRPSASVEATQARFDAARRRVGLVLGPAVCVLLLVLPIQALGPEGQRLAAVTALVIVFWTTEALPLPVTALLGPALAVVLRVAPVRDVLAPVRPSAHLPLHRQLHPGPGALRSPCQRADRLRRAVAPADRRAAHAHSGRLRCDRRVPLRLDEQHGDHGDAGADRGDVRSVFMESESATSRRSYAHRPHAHDDLLLLARRHGDNRSGPRRMSSRSQMINAAARHRKSPSSQWMLFSVPIDAGAAWRSSSSTSTGSGEAASARSRAPRRSSPSAGRRLGRGRRVSGTRSSPSGSPSRSGSAQACCRCCSVATTRWRSRCWRACRNRLPRWLAPSCSSCCRSAGPSGARSRGGRRRRSTGARSCSSAAASRSVARRRNRPRAGGGGGHHQLGTRERHRCDHDRRDGVHRGALEHDVQHRRRQHRGADRHLDRARRRRRPDSARHCRRAGCERRRRPPGLDASQRDRLRLRPYPITTMIRYGLLMGLLAIVLVPFITLATLSLVR